jgi:hypothetical protein
MTSPERAPDRPDQPFPGAHPQVPGTHALATETDAPAGERQLPLEWARIGVGVHWGVRLPVRAENITLIKELVVYERATVHRHQLHDLARVEGSVGRERLAVATEGQVKVVEEPADESPTTHPGPAARNPM